MTGRDGFLRQRAVSRETIDRLDLYEALLKKWNPAINIVASSTANAIWSRHFLDSAQIFDLAGSGTQWGDLGSGGGFPGMVAAILAATERPGLHVTLVESDRRKAAFLAHVAHATGIEISVRAERIETTSPLAANILTARALAPLSSLLGFAARHLALGGRAIFPKGANCEAEIAKALEVWRFSYEKVASRTAAEATILIIGDISRV